MLINYFVNFFIGSCLASHACVIYDRFDQGNFLWGHSYCDFCLQPLALTDELPIISFLILKGKCRFCHEKISWTLLLFEILGGCAFLPIDFSNIKSFSTGIFIFFVLLIAIFDFNDKEFPTIFLLPLFIVTLTKANFWHYFNLLQFLPIASLLILYVYKKKLGSGDLYLYLSIAFFFNPQFANEVFLIASILVILSYLFEKHQSYSSSFAFIPYIFTALIIKNF